MRTLLLSIAIGSCATAHSQNWALLNPAYKYNYSNDGSDTISNQIFVTHIDTLGVDSFRYELNRVGVICPGCSPGYTSQCWFAPPTDLVRAMESQGLGRELVQLDETSYIVGAEDTLLVETMATAGSSWIGPGGISGEIYAVTTIELFGAMDSIKFVAFSNGDTLAISRDHGITLANRAAIGRFDLLGRDGLPSEGSHFPRVIDLFDYQVGDVLQYHDESTFQSSFCVHFVDGRTKYLVLARADEGDICIYTLERTFSSHEESYYPQMWTPCGTYNYEGQEQVSLVVEHDRFAEDNFFNSGLQGQLYPAVLDSVFQEPVSNGLLTSISARVDSMGRHVIEPSIMYSSGWEASLLCQSNEDLQMLFPNSDGNYRFSYTEGVGLTYLDYFSFESGATRTLEGYVLSGQQWGTIWSNSVILGAAEVNMESMSLFPNPASADLYMNDAVLGSVLAITDLQGRVVLRQRITSANQHIDVQAVPAGAYLLVLDGLSPQRFIIAR